MKKAGRKEGRGGRTIGGVESRNGETAGRKDGLTETSRAGSKLAEIVVVNEMREEGELFSRNS